MQSPRPVQRYDAELVAGLTQGSLCLCGYDYQKKKSEGCESLTIRVHTIINHAITNHAIANHTKENHYKLNHTAEQKHVYPPHILHLVVG